MFMVFHSYVIIDNGHMYYLLIGSFSKGGTGCRTTVSFSLIVPNLSASLSLNIVHVSFTCSNI